MGGIQLALNRWKADPFYGAEVFRGTVADLGGTADPFVSIAKYFPLVDDVVTVDCYPHPQFGVLLEDLNEWSPKPGIYDCIVSSHTLEHLHDPHEVFRRWEQGLRPGGYMLVIVPSWDTYERHIWPSRWNPEHKTSWTMDRPNGLDHGRRLLTMTYATETVRATTLDAGFKRHLDLDQTLDGSCECGLELVSHMPGLR